MPQDPQEIFRLFDGKLIGNSHMKYHVCEVLAKMPEETIDYVTQRVWFFASMDDAWAYAFTGNDLKDQHMIFLSDDLFQQDVTQIHYSIAHEIGHVMLGHRNSVHMKQSQKEIDQQEKEADKFAQNYVPASEI